MLLITTSAFCTTSQILALSFTRRKMFLLEIAATPPLLRQSTVPPERGLEAVLVGGGWGWSWGGGGGGGSPLAFQECRRRNDQQLSSRRPCQLGASRGAAAGQSREDLRCVLRTWPASVPGSHLPPPQLRNFPPTPLAHLAPASLAQFQSGPGQLPTGCESHQTRPLTYLLAST